MSAGPPAVLVVSYRRADLLARCLASVAAWLPDADVHVWDNASEGSDAVRELAATLPGISWTFSPQNVGFAPAVNRLAEQVPGDFLLVNPDAVLLGPLAETRRLAALPGVAAAAPFTTGDRGQALWDNARRPPTLATLLVGHAGYAERLRGRAVSDRFVAPPVDGSAQLGTDAIDYLAGSCLLVTRAAWDAVGPLDESYFLYSEEMDWAQRARDRGWRLALADEVGVAHGAAGTVADDAGASRRSSDLLHASQIRFLRTHRGPRAASGFRIGLQLLNRVQRSKRGG